MADEKALDKSNRVLLIAANILLSVLYIFLVIIIGNYESQAFWLSAIVVLGLVYLTFILPQRWGMLRFLFIAAALLFPSALDLVLDIPLESRPNIAFGIYLIAITWVSSIRKVRQARQTKSEDGGYGR